MQNLRLELEKLSLTRDLRLIRALLAHTDLQTGHFSEYRA